MTRPHAALPCHHTTPTFPHIAAALAPFSPLCACGRELHGVSYVDGRQADLAHVHRRGGRGGECRQLPAHAMLPSQGAWVAPAEPPASGEAQCAYGEETAEKGQRKHAVYCRRVGVWRARLHAGAQPGAAWRGSRALLHRQRAP